ncbi:M48 family metallopeptidase [Botrimarina mediterranea]|uniref:YgjP-like metallopeptidase domain-containing protein n=1 Tax=Botrimarina mediterranea TaxID=2528022 RepID=A0A518K7E6_9BACT|nr:SprT family zinc-dependent metalloprotease [Botrimarina mediterranea]QDV73718.1 hypothetical protein Spa11_19170 [Botrimarina mediterranea]
MSQKPTDRDGVQYGTTRIEYAIERTNRRKTIGITVRPDQSVVVAAPKGTRRTRIAEKVRGKSAWIVQQRERNSACQRNASRQFQSGETLLYLGKQYQLKVTVTPTADPVSVLCYQGKFLAQVNSSLGKSERAGVVRKALEAWYRERCTARLDSCIEKHAKQIGVTPVSVQVREMKSRWGSASADGRLRFNWRIVMAPKPLFEYVVAHELCHLRHPSHGRDFWRLLAIAMPDHVSRCLRLEAIGPSLTI